MNHAPPFVVNVQIIYKVIPFAYTPPYLAMPAAVPEKAPGVPPTGMESIFPAAPPWKVMAACVALPPCGAVSEFAGALPFVTVAPQVVAPNCWTLKLAVMPLAVCVLGA